MIPQSAGRSECLDLDDNCVTQLWFNDPTDTLRIESAFVVETLRTNPFDFLITTPAGLKLPMHYPTHLAQPLGLYQQGTASITDDLVKFAHDVGGEVEWEAMSFLSALAARLAQSCEVVIREQGDPLPSMVTLAERRGSCRDLTVLFIDLCHVMGLAARFVSGYQQGDSDQPRRDLHAWAEVYLPGAGWRGYDPTMGLAVADRHVAVAAAHSFRGAAPICGTFRGTDVTATLRNHIAMRAFEAGSL